MDHDPNGNDADRPDTGRVYFLGEDAGSVHLFWWTGGTSEPTEVARLGQGDHVILGWVPAP